MCVYNEFRKQWLGGVTLYKRNDKHDWRAPTLVSHSSGSLEGGLTFDMHILINSETKLMFDL